MPDDSDPYELSCRTVVAGDGVCVRRTPNWAPINALDDVSPSDVIPDRSVRISIDQEVETCARAVKPGNDDLPPLPRQHDAKGLAWP